MEYPPLVSVIEELFLIQSYILFGIASLITSINYSKGKFKNTDFFKNYVNFWIITILLFIITDIVKIYYISVTSPPNAFHFRLLSINQPVRFALTYLIIYTIIATGALAPAIYQSDYNFKTLAPILLTFYFYVTALILISLTLSFSIPNTSFFRIIDNAIPNIITIGISLFFYIWIDKKTNKIVKLFLFIASITLILLYIALTFSLIF